MVCLSRSDIPPVRLPASKSIRQAVLSLTHRVEPDITHKPLAYLSVSVEHPTYYIIIRVMSAIPFTLPPAFPVVGLGVVSTVLLNVRFLPVVVV
jgi:hypothetical protein